MKARAKNVVELESELLVLIMNTSMCNECSGVEFWKLYICYMLKLVQTFVVCYIREEL